MPEGLVGKIRASLKEGFRCEETELEKLIMPVKVKSYSYVVHKPARYGEEGGGFLLSPAEDYVERVQKYYTPSGRMICWEKQNPGITFDICNCCGRTYGRDPSNYEYSGSYEGYLEMKLIRRKGKRYWIPYEKNLGVLDIGETRWNNFGFTLGLAYIRLNEGRSECVMSEEVFHTLRREHAAYEKGKKI